MGRKSIEAVIVESKIFPAPVRRHVMLRSHKAVEEAVVGSRWK